MTNDWAVDSDVSVDAGDAGGDFGDMGGFVEQTEQQIADGCEAVEGMPELSPETWGQLDSGQRLTALQDLEGSMAMIEGRPAVPVEPREMEANVFGYWNGSEISVNQDHLAGEVPVSEVANTIVHEGRHAFQEYAVANPGLVDPEVAAMWAGNFETYLDAEQYGMEAYLSQPIEADAFGFADAIIPPNAGGS